MQLKSQGYALVHPLCDEELLVRLRENLFENGKAGTRCLLDVPEVRECALSVLSALRDAGVLPESSVCVQAIAFDKSASANWKVAWHQDLMFPLAGPAKAAGYSLPCIKEGVDYARPPLPILQAMLAVRLHLDPCEESNGPLRISPGTHRLGVIPPDRILPVRVAHGELACLAQAGEALLMRPLLLHASSKATVSHHRRVLHLVFHDGSSVAEPWHRAV